MRPNPFCQDTIDDMCGIHGIVNLNGGAPPSLAHVKAMGDISIHRGPDDEGEYADEHVAFGMRRLSIIDVAGGHQPIANEDGNLWVVCNGEIYNFRELRAELERLGHRFSTNSDSEVIVHMYEEYGDGFVTRLNGMYAFALWDVRRRRMLIGRDPLGIKPLYYMASRGRLLFASELKSILAVPGAEAKLDEVSLSEYLALGYCPAPRSMIRGIRKLRPGCVLQCADGSFAEIEREPHTAGRQGERSEEEWLEALGETLEAAVRSQMVSDVPLGAFLSGGIDSSAVVAMMARHSVAPVQTYAIGFGESSGGSFYNELPYAKQVSELFATRHREIVVQPDVVELLPKLLWHLDEPVADSAFITTFLVSRFAREDVTVILSGVGGDELFGGYRRYLGEYYGALYRRIPAWCRHHLLAPIARRLPSSRSSQLLNVSRYAKRFILSHDSDVEERYRSYVQVFGPREQARLLGISDARNEDALDRAFARAPDGDELNRLFGVDMATQLPDDLLMLTDRMSMATSLECRVPLLDDTLVALAAGMPSKLKIRGRNLKYCLKRSLSGVLPDEILYRRKRGFGAPFGAWMKEELGTMLDTVLSRETVAGRGLLDWDEVQRTIVAHRSNQEDHTDHLLSLVNLELWSRMYLDGVEPAALTDELMAGAGA